MRLILCFLVSVGATMTSLAFGPAHPLESRDVDLQPDRSIVLGPTERITLRFEFRDGKLLNPRVVPFHPTQPDTVTFWIVRTGGRRAVTGPTVPIRDALSITTNLPGIVTARCTYSAPNLSKPKSIPSARNGRSFDGPITRATLTDITLKPK
jgi:hypothetical protein